MAVANDRYCGQEAAQSKKSEWPSKWIYVEQLNREQGDQIGRIFSHLGG
jgi:hypothetical protein